MAVEVVFLWSVEGQSTVTRNLFKIDSLPSLPVSDAAGTLGFRALERVESVV